MTSSPFDGTPSLESELGRHVASFVPRGIGRFFSAAFLTVWLCGWAVGEAAAGGMVFGLLAAGVAPGAVRGIRVVEDLRHSPALGPVLLFLGVWLSLWTLGGVLAIREWLRLLWGSDRIEWDGQAVIHTRRLGPFQSTRRWPYADVLAVRLQPRVHGLELVLPRRTSCSRGMAARMSAERSATRYARRLAAGALRPSPTLTFQSSGMKRRRPTGARCSRPIGPCARPRLASWQG